MERERADEGDGDERDKKIPARPKGRRHVRSVNKRLNPKSARIDRILFVTDQMLESTPETEMTIASGCKNSVVTRAHPCASVCSIAPYALH
jgi:hypothetical protein